MTNYFNRLSLVRPPPSFPCAYCQGLIEKGKMKCPHCKMWQAVTHYGGEDSTPTEKRRAKTSLLSDTENVAIPRYITGPWDLLFGGGVAYTSVTLLSGKSGCGKTTLCFQAADAIIAETAGEVLYVAGEQSREELRQYAERFGIIHLSKFRLCPIEPGLDIESEILDYQPKLVVIDSLPAVCSPESAIQFVRTMKGVSVLNKSPILILNHSTKDGQHAGYEAVKHWVDTTIFIRANEKNNVRSLVNGSKNRMGECKSLKLMMVERGLIPMNKEDTK